MKLFLALLWTFILVINIYCMFNGSEPNWILVFCPLLEVVFHYWTDYLEEKDK